MAVRSSAMIAVAECVSALGPRCLPQLVTILDTVLGGAETSLARLPQEVTATPVRHLSMRHSTVKAQRNGSLLQSMRSTAIVRL